MLERILVIAALCMLVSCASTQVPADFLRADTDAWRRWMDTIVDVDLDNVPISQLPTHAPFESMNMTLERTGQLRHPMIVSLHAHRIARREALWRIAQKYNLTMDMGYFQGRPFCISITKK